MAFIHNFKNHIRSQVEAAIDLVFINSHKYALTESGDITPEQQAELDTIKESLKRLVEIQVTQNLTEEQLKSYGIQIPQDASVEALKEKSIWTVPVCRTGWGSRIIEVIARTEQEAIDLAIDAAGDESFSENDAEYSAPDGAHTKL